MGWLEGLLSGYADRHHAIQAENLALDQQAQQREQQVYEKLLEHENDDIADMAAAGLLSLGQPRKRKSGFAGWMGEMAASPQLAAIQRFRQTLGPGEQVPVPQQPSIPTVSGSLPTTPGLAGSAAQPSTSLVTGGPTTPATPAPQVSSPLASERAQRGFGAALEGLPAPPPPDLFQTPYVGMEGLSPPVDLPPGRAEQMVGSAFTAAGLPPRPELGPLLLPSVPGTLAGTSPLAQAAAASSPEVAAIAAGAGGPPGTTAPSGMPAAVPGGTPGAVGTMGAGPAPPAMPVTAGPPLPPPPPPAPAPGVVSDGLPGAATKPVGPLTAPRPKRTRLFPTEGDRQSQLMRSEVDTLGRLLYESGDPNWQQNAIQAVLQKYMPAGSLQEGPVRQLPDGSWGQDLYDRRTGQIVRTLPASAPIGSGAVQTRDAIAFRLFGKQGEDPKGTIRRLTPTQMAKVMETERTDKALTAAEVALAKAKVEANAPLAAQAKSQLIEQLNTKWTQLQAPVKKLSRDFNEMVIGVARMKDDPVGAVEAVRVGFEKLLDPDSVVREGEYNRQTLGLGILQRMEGFWQSLKGGGNIPQAQLAQMVETARQMLAAVQNVNDDERQRIEDRAAEHEIDPGYIFGGGVGTPPPKLDTGGIGGAGGAGAGAGAGGAGAGGAGGTIDLKTKIRVDENGNLVGVQ